MKIKTRDKDLVLGGFHTDPSGGVWKSYGFNAVKGVVFCYQYKEPAVEIPENVVRTWEKLDVDHFPGCDHDDESIPYVFDLHWDIKTKGELRHLIEERVDWNQEEFDELVATHFDKVGGEFINKVPAAAVEDATTPDRHA